jgi:hypothetical protein
MTSCLFLRILLQYFARGSHSISTHHTSFLPTIVPPVVDMVKTRSGHGVFYTETSYGRAARSETTRKRKKQKLLKNDSSPCDDDDNDTTNNSNGITASTPRSGRKTRGQIREEENLRTPPGAKTRVGTTPPSKNDGMITRGRMPTCSQSRNLCIPLKIMMGREMMETFHQFRTLFSSFEDLM